MRRASAPGRVDAGASGRAGRADPSIVAAWLAAIGIGLIALGLSVWRLMPGLGFWDTAEFQMVPPVLGTAHPTGYPTYVILGWAGSLLMTPLGEPALRMNVLSALLVAVGVAFTVDLGRRLSGSLLLGVVAGLGAALTPIIWAIGTHADPHALHFTLFAIVLWLLVSWEHRRVGNPMSQESGRSVDVGRSRDDRTGRRADRLLLAAAVVVGLSVGNHSLTLLLGPPILAFVLAVEPGIVRRWRFVAACVAAFAIPTILVRLELVLRAGWFRAPFVYADPSTWDGFWYVTLGAQFHDWVTNPLADPAGRIADVAAITAAQLGPLAPLVLVAFAVSVIRQPRWALLSGLTMAITLFFNSVYPDGAIDRYYIVPAVFAWTWLVILGSSVVDVLTGRDLVPGVDGDIRPGIGGSLRPIGLAVVAVVLIAPSLAAVPARARLVDRTADRSAQIWTDEVLAALEPDAVVVSWWSYSTPLWYATIVDERRPDICIIDDRNRLDYDLGDLDHVIDRYIATRPVYLIRNGGSELGSLAGKYDVSGVGAPTATNLLRVTPVATTSSSPAAGAGRAPAATAPAPAGAVYPREACS
ncbi:MAG TPA: DUF2723 domain-containing protein [Patescibacteria group bacterium]|nr:DUF2723 domain-containing protein [Patescibacteria group bacterium]